MTDDQRRLTAIHEAGHTVVAWLLTRGRMPEGPISIRVAAGHHGISILGDAGPPVGVGAAVLGPLLGERHRAAEVAAAVYVAGPIAEELWAMTNADARFATIDEVEAERIIAAAVLPDREAAALARAEGDDDPRSDADAAWAVAVAYAGESLAAAWLAYVRAAVRSTIASPPVRTLIGALAGALDAAEVMSAASVRDVLAANSYASVRALMSDRQEESDAPDPQAAVPVRR